MSFQTGHSEAADRAAQGPQTGEQLQAINQCLGKVGEEARIMFPVLNLCRASSVNAEAKLSKRGTGSELCTKPGQAGPEAIGQATPSRGSLTPGSLLPSFSGLCKGPPSYPTSFLVSADST